MAELDHEKIRVIAYELWERDGAPDGRDDEYWHAAVRLLSDDAAGSVGENSPDGAFLANDEYPDDKPLGAPSEDPASELPIRPITPPLVK